MAIFLPNAKYGHGFDLDFTETSPFTRFIGKLAAEGVTSGCGETNVPLNRLRVVRWRFS